jgi:hypothetical protein
MMSSVRYSIAGRKFDLQLLGAEDRERVRDLAIRMLAWRDAQPYRDIISGCPPPPYLIAEAAEWFIRIAGFPFTEIVPRFDCENSAVWAAVLTAAGFDEFPGGGFDISSRTGTC